MHTPSPGPLASLDRSALNAASKVAGVYQWPTTAILASLWAYLCTLAMAAFATPYFRSASVRTALLLTPFLTLILAVGICYFVYRGCDEYVRLRILRSAALTGVILAFSTLGYFCLERIGYPPLSMIAVNVYGWVIFTLLMLRVRPRAA